MFLSTTRSGYTRDGEQFAQGPFLMIFQDHNDSKSRSKLRGVVRHVKMSQCGHFMMAHVTLGGVRIALSGTYGGDGLPIHLPTAHGIIDTGDDARMMTSNRLLKQMTELPAELTAAFWDGGGHNTGGSEMPSLHDWARQNVVALRRPIKDIGPISINEVWHQHPHVDGQYLVRCKLADYYPEAVGKVKCYHFVSIGGLKSAKDA